MSRRSTPLRDTQCQNAKAKSTAYELSDGYNLNLRVHPTGRKTWRWKYKKTRGANYESPITLGNYPALSLKDARALRVEYESMLARGLDPKYEIAKQKNQKSDGLSIESVTKAWLSEYALRKPLSENTKIKRLQKFENHFFPHLRFKSIVEITLQDLREVLNKIYQKSPDTSQRIRDDLIKIFSYALQHNYINSNIARDLDGMDLSYTKGNMATFNTIDERIPDLIRKIKTDTGQPLTKLFLLLALHTFIRSSELRFARWEEIDFKSNIWKVPAQRVSIDGVKNSGRGAKLRKEYVIPLSHQAVALLEQIKIISGRSDKVFPSIKGGAGFLSESTPNNALQRMGYAKEDICLHGFRALARSALQEMGLFTHEALERQLNHTEKNNTVKAYNHIAQHMIERTSMMNIWSDWLDLVEIKGFISPYDYGKQYHREVRETNSVQLISKFT